MLQYSYKTELRRYEARRLALDIAQLKIPSDDSILKRIEETDKQIAWLRGEIEMGHGLKAETV